MNKVATKKEARQDVGVGANVFVGNLDGDIDEKMLYDTFSVRFCHHGTESTTRSRYGREQRPGFVQFIPGGDDRAIEAMRTVFAGKQITVVYAYKKDTNGKDTEPS